jgi:hypothetical protein
MFFATVPPGSTGNLTKQIVPQGHIPETDSYPRQPAIPYRRSLQVFVPLKNSAL